jgi:hypothetical protein
LKALGKKLLVLLLMGTTTMAAFAITGDGKGKKTNTKKSLLTNKPPMAPGQFSLKTGYKFRGSQIFTPQENQYINLNTVVTFQKGHTSFIMPLKKKVVLNDKIVFNPNAATRNH